MKMTNKLASYSEVQITQIAFWSGIYQIKSLAGWGCELRIFSLLSSFLSHVTAELERLPIY
jgi:hypothetical protein